MNSILIRFTDSKYADSYRSGNLSFSSLYSFWDLRRNKIPYEKAPFASKEELLKAANDKQQDFSEGISLEIPSSILAESKDFYPHICNDTIRARIDAYGYCKLLCFYRVDITGSVIQNLPSEMFNFGNTVIVVKDEKEFKKSVINAIAKRGEDCVLGDVSYHDVWTKPREHSVTLISEEPFFPLSAARIYNTRHFGCLDKYVYFKAQREYRVCWLPNVHDHERKNLDIGPAQDLFDVIPARDLRKYLREKYPKHKFGQTYMRKPHRTGTDSYDQFMNKVESINGLCSLIFEVH